MSNEIPANFERIERYLMNEMSAEEEQDFLLELKKDDTMREEMEAQREMQLSIEMGSMGEAMNEIHEGVASSSNSPSGKNWIAIAAGFALLVSVGIWAVNQGSQTENLFAEYATTDPGVPVPMSATDNYDFYDGMVDYKETNYQAALAKWDSLLAENPENDTLNFYHGAALFNLENYRAAIPYFDTAEANSTSTIRDKAQWYRVLTGLKLDDKELVLGIAPYPGSAYAERIEEIQSELKK